MLFVCDCPAGARHGRPDGFTEGSLPSLADAEIRKHAIDDGLRGVLAGDLIQPVQRLADVDGGSVDITDVTSIQRYLAGFHDPYDIGATVSYNVYAV